MEVNSNSSVNVNPKVQRKFSFSFFMVRWKLRKAKNRLLNINGEKTTINIFIGLAFFSIVAGLIIFLFFLVKLSNEYSISGSRVILDKSGQVGDFIGGIVGAIWGLTGVLLFYATLRLQSKELAENRKHFQMSRLTDIIYKQIDLFNSQLVNFTLKDLEKDQNGDFIEYKGCASISLLRKQAEKILDIEKKSKGKDEEEKQKDTYKFIGENFAFIEINRNELHNIYEELKNQVSVIRAVLIKEDIPPADLNELKALFFKNIGSNFFRASELLQYYMEWYITFKKNRDEEFEELFSIENSIVLDIKVIEEFRNKRYDKETIKMYVKSREMYNETSF